MSIEKPAIIGGEPVSKHWIPIAKPIIGDEEKQAVMEALEKGALASGEFIEKFEKEFARYIGVKHAIATSCGTDALFISYLSLDLTFNKKILTTPLTFIATASAAICTGAIPIFADVEEDANISPEEISKVLEKEHINGICVVHMYGKPCRMEKILSMAREYNIPVIEDASHAHGAEYKGKKVGNLGDIAAFSLYPAKIIAAGGWGGVIVTNNDELAETARLIALQGELREVRGTKTAYEFVRIGYNMRMSNIEAAVAYYQLRKLNKFIEIRRKYARILTEMLEDVPGIKTPTDPAYGKHVYYLYVITIDEKKIGWSRDEFVEALRKENIDARRGYHKPLHQQELFLKINDPRVNYFAKIVKYPEYSKLSYPTAEKLSKTSVWLPCHPALTEKDVENIGKAIRKLISWKTGKKL